MFYFHPTLLFSVYFFFSLSFFFIIRHLVICSPVDSFLFLLFYFYHLSFSLLFSYSPFRFSQLFSCLLFSPNLCTRPITSFQNSFYLSHFVTISFSNHPLSFPVSLISRKRFLSVLYINHSCTSCHPFQMIASTDIRPASFSDLAAI